MLLNNIYTNDMTENSKRQATFRSRQKAAGLSILHVAIAPHSKLQLLALSESLHLTHRAVIELLLDAGHKKLLSPGEKR